MLMPATKPDRRVVRTRELLLDAFVSLLLERGYERMTVQDLLDRAGVGRATFYAHFRSKDDLLTSSVSRLEGGLRHACTSGSSERAAPSEPLGFTHAFFRHVQGHRRILGLIIDSASGQAVDHHMRRMLSRLVREDLVACGCAKQGSAALEVAVQFVVGALCSLIAWWAATRSRLTPDELNEMFRRLVFRGLDSSLGRRVAYRVRSDSSSGHTGSGR